MGLFSRSQPKIKVKTSKRDGYSGWLKCSHCSELIHINELQQNLNCCPKCSYHYRMSAEERLKLLTDPESFQELFTEVITKDPLKFQDSITYQERIEQAQKGEETKEAIITGVATLEKEKFALAILDFSFMAGSMGSVVGERLTRLIEYALKKAYPLVVVSASGGARMQESTLSLMQMAKTSAALSRFHKAGLFFLSILTNPTSGGVTASFASLGDIIIAEPDALICFAGPRVIEQTIGQKLPPGAQKSEFLLEHGMIDCIFSRSELKQNVAKLLKSFKGPEKLPAELTGQKKLPKKLREFMQLDLDENKG